MAVIAQSDLEDALSVSTVRSIFDDANNNTVSASAVAAVIRRAESQVFSYLAMNYPDLEIPYTSSPAPEVLKSAVLEFAIVYARDRKPEYWANNSRERKERLDGAFEMADRFAKAKQIVYGVGGVLPSNVGGRTSSDAASEDETPPKFFVDGTGDY